MGARGRLKMTRALTVVPDGTAAADVPAEAPGTSHAVWSSDEPSRLWDEIVRELNRAGLVTVSD
ncbi:hypothetical protein, partial [Salmonella enterica]|uniref:hypothetical protein n=1 Tax=Salmonella enterica TaxID=28901 RepID=UPI0039ECC90D